MSGSEDNARPGFTGAARVLAGLLESRTGQILSENRVWRIETALKPVLRANGIDTVEDLVSRLLMTSDARLTGEVVDALLNNESSFFRDLQLFDMLGRDLLPHLAATRTDRRLRIWCAGCSTGQEAFSLAMLLRRNPAQWQGYRIQIVATDISATAIARAQSGIFSQIDVQRGLAVNDLLRWFEPVGDDWKVKDDLRRMIDFRVDNLFKPAVPCGQYDLILCRNVLLYFSAERRRQVLSTLSDHSAPGGFLMLGAGETVIGQTDRFSSSRTFRGTYEHGCGTLRTALRSAAFGGRS